MVESITPNRNLVMITVDSLRADYCYSSDLPTPAMDALAESGIRFENAIASGPATYESMPAIFTGTQPGPANGRGGLGRRDQVARHLRAHRPIPTRLGERGYTTIGVTPNPFTSREFGFDTGFDRFVDFFDAAGFGGGLRRRIVSRWADGKFVGGLRFASNMLGLGDVSVSSSAVVSRAVSAIDVATEPIFLWLMFLDPHWPYRPPPRYRGGTGPLDRYRSNWRASNLSDSTPTGGDVEVLQRLYRGTIRDVDDCLASLRERLEPLDPVYVVHADHGEAFGEHGHFGHGGRLFEENVRVPLIVGGIGSSADVRRPTSLRVIPRLLADLSDGTVDPRACASARAHAMSEAGDRCVRGAGWKYYVTNDGRTRLFDLHRDPAEQRGSAVDIEDLRAEYEARTREVSALQKTARERIPTDRL